jgi:hypothetical protein
MLSFFEPVGIATHFFASNTLIHRVLAATVCVDTSEFLCKDTNY